MTRPGFWLVLLCSAGCVAAPARVERASSGPLPRQAQLLPPVEAFSASSGGSLPTLPAGQSVLPPGGAPHSLVATQPVNQSLDLDTLTEQVLSRNPSLQQMVAAWQAAQARYPQMTSLDDPMFGSTVGPGSIGSNSLTFAYRVEVAQKIPAFGKLQLRGASAQADANAAGLDVDDVRLQLIESTKNAFLEYYLVGRLLAINAESARLLKEFKANAESRYKTGQASQQDVLQADVELGRQQERLLELEQMQRVAQGRINTLLHRATDTVLPPPGELPAAAALPSLGGIRETLQTRRPDLQALASRVAAEEANLALALKERCPDMEIMAAYDSFWQSPEAGLRSMLGVKLNLPVRLNRIRGAIAEAQAKLAQRRAELASRTDQALFQLQEAHAQTERALKVARLYETKIVPSARDNVKAAQAAYVTGKVPFLSLIEAQRNLILLRERHEEAIVAVHKGLAALERAAGGLP